MKKRLQIFTVSTVIMLLSGCGTMMVMLGDNIRYSISGTVQDMASAEDNKCIANVKVSIECPGTEKSIYQNRKGITDQNGYYQLSGYWELTGCQIGFNHENYTAKTINIDQSNLIESSGLSRTYTVNALLQRKTNTYCKY